MASSDDLLAALDPEQREVAERPARPGAGARRRRHRQDPGDHPPHRLRRGHGRLQPHRGAGRHLHHPGRRRDAHPAAHDGGRRLPRPAPSTPPRCASCASSGPRSTAASRRQLIESKIPLLALAARRNRVEVNQALLRDLASEIEWAKVSNVRPDDYERLAAARGREVAGADAATVARVFAGYEEVKRDQGRMDMEDVLLLTRRRCSADDERVAAEVRRQYNWFVVDEFQDVSPLQAALLDLWLGGRDEICVVGDPAQTIYSFAGANAGVPPRLPAKFPGTTTVELVRNYRSTPAGRRGRQRACSAGTARSVELRSQRAAGPRGRPSAGDPTRSPRPRRSLPGSPSCATRRAAARDGGAVPHQRPVRGLRGGADRPRHPLRRPRRGAVLRPPGGARGRDAAARRRRGRRARGASGDDLVDQVRAHAGRHGLDAARPRRPAARPATAGSRWQALVTQAEDVRPSRRRRRRTLGGVRRRPRPPRPRAARPGRRGRHPRHVPRRQGPGVGRGVPRRPPGRHPADHLRRHPGRRSRRSAGCSTSA